MQICVHLVTSVHCIILFRYLCWQPCKAMLSFKHLLRTVRVGSRVAKADETLVHACRSGRCYSSNHTETSLGAEETIDAAGTQNERSDDQLPASAKKFEFPKLYMDDKLLKMKFRRDRDILKKRMLWQWLDDHDPVEDWPNRWGGPKPFDPHKVPLDIRMGSPQNLIPQPSKYGNLELAKVQNFLHLTPPVIKKHCQRLKEFCTEWPPELKSDEDCERAFPVEVHTTDYVRSAQSQRNPAARITTLRIRLCHLVLDHHARLKLMKLAGDRYDPKTDLLTITADRCPIRKQNREYLDYLLTVLYYEAWKHEQWETREYIEDQDGIYWWKDSNSHQSLMRILKSHDKTEGEGTELVDDELENVEEVKEYRRAVESVKLPDQNATKEEKIDTILRYKESVRKLLKLPELT